MGFRVIWGNAWAWAWASGVGVWGSGWFGAMHARGVACLHVWHMALQGGCAAGEWAGGSLQGCRPCHGGRSKAACNG